MRIEAGQQIQHYRLIERIGEGGMGVVWKAEDTRLLRPVALKFVPEERADDPETVERHLREARAASSLNHPNICSIFDLGEWQGRRYIVMELLDGETLAQRLQRGALDPEVALELAIQIAEALDAAHRNRIVHRDVKPGNVVVLDDDRPRAKVLDFGLAKLARPAPGGGAEDRTLTAHDLTAEHTAVGTAPYMSPEQALGSQVDARSDLFSLGALLYEMATGRRAFQGDTAAAVFDSLLNRQPPPPSQIVATISPELERVVRRALEKDPALRYQTAADLAADLRGLRAVPSGEGLPVPAKRRGRRRALLVALPLLIALAALGVWSLRNEGGAGPGVTASSRESSEGGRDAGPSIAVLPFANASGDPEQEYFSDGLTEAIIAELSRYRELAVTAHNSTARYKGSEADPGELGEALGVRYLLRGAVHRAGDRVRLNVELSDTRDGRTLWGTSYERDLTARDLFALQDDLTQQVVNAVAGSYGALARAELPEARRQPPSSLASYDCVLRAYDYLQVHTAEKHRAARECLEEVVEDDPDYADGRAWLAYLYAEEYHHRRNERPEQYDALERALELAREAVRLDPASTVAHGSLALTHFFRGDWERARIETERTIELSPNNALWLTLLGTYLVQVGDQERGLEMIARAIELDPHPPAWIGMGFFYRDYRAGRFEEALAQARRMELFGDFREPLFLAATLGQLGRVEEARPIVDELRTLWPRPLPEMRRELIERHATAPDLVDRLLEGLAKAGLEVGAASAGF